MEGYWQDEKQTAEALSPDGWFKTGDIGEWDHNGHLKIIDRKKNLVKTLNGEYIALEKLESVYRAATVVANICVYADEQKTKPVAIIVPAEAALVKLAERIGVQGHGIEDLAHNKKVQEAVLVELQQAGRQGGLSGIEIIEGAVVADEEWTPQNVVPIFSLAKVITNKLIGLHYFSTEAEQEEDSGPIQKGGRCCLCGS